MCIYISYVCMVYVAAALSEIECEQAPAAGSYAARGMHWYGRKNRLVRMCVYKHNIYV